MYTRKKIHKKTLEKKRGNKIMINLKKQKGIALINLIIIFLLILVLCALGYLIYADLRSQGYFQNNNNLANNLNQQNTLNQQDNINEQNNLYQSDNTNNEEEIDNNTNTDTTDTIITIFDENNGNNSTDNIDEDYTLNENSSITTNNTYKIGDTINIERNKMVIIIEEVEAYTDSEGKEIYRAKTTFTNNNEKTLENLSPLILMIRPISFLGTTENPYYLNNAETIEDNLLEKRVESGETISGYIYWNSSRVEYLKILPIVGIIDAENGEYEYGEPYYVEIKQ